MAFAHVLTTGQVAQLFGVSRRRVRDWIDAEMLRILTVPSATEGPRPGKFGRNLRITLESVFAFAHQHKIASPELQDIGQAAGYLPAAPLPLLLVTTDSSLYRWFGLHGRFDVATAEDGLQAVDRCNHRAYRAVVIDTATGRPETTQLLTWLRDRRPSVVKAILAYEDWPDVIDGTVEIRQPCDLNAAARELWGLVMARGSAGKYKVLPSVRSGCPVPHGTPRKRRQAS